MNVASPELCKTLHELSGWDGHLDKYTVQGTLVDYHDAVEAPYPAYDLGYLLRKLPGYPAIQKLNANPDEWLLEAMALGYHASGRGDTPEDAAAKLAIELFKQGILTKPEKEEV